MLSVEGEREREGGCKELVRVRIPRAFHLPLKMSSVVTQLRMSTQARPGMQIGRDPTCEIRQTDGHTDGWTCTHSCVQVHR